MFAVILHFAHKALGLHSPTQENITTIIASYILYLGALRVEVAGRGSEDQVAVGVSLPGLDQREIASDGLLHHVVAAVEVAGLAGLAGDRHGLVGVVLDGETALLDHGAVGGGSEEGGDTGT